MNTENHGPLVVIDCQTFSKKELPTDKVSKALYEVRAEETED